MKAKRGAGARRAAVKHAAVAPVPVPVGKMVLVKGLTVGEELVGNTGLIIRIGEAAYKRTTAVVVALGGECGGGFEQPEYRAGSRVVIGAWAKPEVVDGTYHAVRETDIVAVID